MTDNKTVTIAVSLDVGILCVGKVQNTIKSFCHRNGFDVEIDKGCGFLSKPLFVTIKCHPKYIETIREFFNKGDWLND